MSLISDDQIAKLSRPRLRRKDPKNSDTRKEIRTEDVRPHITIEIDTYSNDKDFDHSYRVNLGTVDLIRDYNDFVMLYRLLQFENWGCIVPCPPGRLPLDSDETSKSIHLLILRDMLIGLSNNQQFTQSKVFGDFSTQTNFKIPSDEELYLQNFELSSAQLDLSVILSHGSIEAIGHRFITHNILDSRKGLLKLSFTNAPQYLETDTFFVETIDHIKRMESQLKQLILFVEDSKNEIQLLHSVSQELTKSLSTYAENELIKQISDPLHATCKKLSHSADVTHQSYEEFTNTLHSFLSIKVAIFNSVYCILDQRKILGTLLANQENDLKKLKLANTKSSQSNNADQGKITLQLQELKEAQERYNIISVKFDILGNTIKTEIKRFYSTFRFEIIDFFKTQVENSVGSQKQLIEIWDSDVDTDKQCCK